MEPTIMSLEGLPTEQAITSLPVITAFIVGFIVFFVVVGLLMVTATCRVYMKAGKKWWEAIVPIYNVIVWLDIIKKSHHIIWLYLGIVALMFMGERTYDIALILNFVLAIWLTYFLSRRFGKGAWFTIGLIFLPFIFWPILAWGKANYIQE